MGNLLNIIHIINYDMELLRKDNKPPGTVKSETRRIFYFCGRGSLTIILFNSLEFSEMLIFTNPFS